MSSSQTLFESLYGTITTTSHYTEECAAAISRRKLHKVASDIVEEDEEEDEEEEERDGSKERKGKDSTESKSDRESYSVEMYERSETIEMEAISILQRKQSELLSQIWKTYDEGDKGYLVEDDMRHILHDYLQVLLRKSPSRVVNHAIEGAKIGVLIARKRNDYVGAIDQDTADALIEQIERCMNLLRRDIEDAVTNMIVRLLRPTTLRRIALDVFEACDAGTKDGWVSELEFTNGFLHSVHRAIEWNEVLASANKIIGAVPTEALSA